MLIVLGSVSLILLIILISVAIYGSNMRREGIEACGIGLSILFGMALVVSLGFIFSFSADVCNAHTIDSKIAMYEEENAKIEEKINITVENYLKHEQETLTNLSPENAMAILASYPELKSDTLVASQVEKYIANTEEVKALKEAKIDIARKKWWLYFGS